MKTKPNMVEVGIGYQVSVFFHLSHSTFPSQSQVSAAIFPGVRAKRLHSIHFKKKYSHQLKSPKRGLISLTCQNRNIVSITATAVAIKAVTFFPPKGEKRASFPSYLPERQMSKINSIVHVLTANGLLLFSFCQVERYRSPRAAAAASPAGWGIPPQPGSVVPSPPLPLYRGNGGRVRSHSGLAGEPMPRDARPAV